MSDDRWRMSGDRCMKKKLLPMLAVVLAIFTLGYWWSERDWQTHECTGYIVGKSHGANTNRRAIAAWSPQAAQIMRPLCEDEYGLELQARMGRLDCPIRMFDVDRVSYEAYKEGERVTIRYREHRDTHERLTLAVIPLHEWWDSYAK